MCFYPGKDTFKNNKKVTILMKGIRDLVNASIVAGLVTVVAGCATPQVAQVENQKKNQSARVETPSVKSFYEIKLEQALMYLTPEQREYVEHIGGLRNITGLNCPYSVEQIMSLSEMLYYVDIGMVNERLTDKQ
jgi:hypothetical protein